MQGFEEFKSVAELTAARQKLLDERNVTRQVETVKTIREWIRLINEWALDLRTLGPLIIPNATRRVYDYFMAVTNYPADFVQLVQLRSARDSYELVVHPFWQGNQEGVNQ